MHHRPTGVSILAALTILGGAWVVCFSSAAFAWSPIAAIFGESLLGTSIYGLIRGVLYIILGIGL